MQLEEETNKGILYSTYKRIAPKVLDFEKLNYDYFKNELTDNDVWKIIFQLQKELC